MESTVKHIESALPALIADGDQSAFATFFELYNTRVYSYALKILHLPDVAEDVVQEVFIKVWNHRAQLPSINNIESWVITITRNQIYNHLRSLAQEEKFIRQVLAENSSNETVESMAFNELHNLLQQAINNLSPQQKKVYELSRNEGLSRKEIAELLGISSNTVKTYMQEALRDIRHFLKQHDQQILILLLALLEK